MINYKEITGVSVGEVHFTPDMVIQACKDSVKAAIPLILKCAADNVTGYYYDEEGQQYDAFVFTHSITSLQDTLEKQLGL